MNSRTWKFNPLADSMSAGAKNWPIQWLILGLLCGSLWFILGCNQQQHVDETASIGLETPILTPGSTATAIPTATPSLTPTPSITPTPQPLTAAEVFSQVANSMAYIDTPIGSGSGILLEDGYVLTNLHVVWPYHEVRIVFPDGTEETAVPVLNWDFLADLAILGPINTDLPPLTLVDGEQSVIGSDVFLVGYPGETEKLPQPSITRGLISRLRQWEQADITYFQTDAAITGGQSGGALVSDQGYVIGISGLRFSDADFGLIASAKDIIPRVQSLIAGEALDGLGVQRLPANPVGSKKNRVVSLQSQWDEATYIIEAPVGDKVEITLDGAKSGFNFIDPRGFFVLHGDGKTTRAEVADIEVSGPHFLTVFRTSTIGGVQNLYSSHELGLFEDPDNGKLVKIGETYVGNLDYPGDIDYFLLLLQSGEVVNISVDSLATDPYISITYDGAQSSAIISDDDSGGGVFGLNAELTYAAPHQSLYTIIVRDSSYFGNVGAYLLTIEEPDDADPTPSAPQPTPTPIATELGEMTLYQNSEVAFAIQYPADWSPEWVAETGYEAICDFAVACFAGQPGAILAVVYEEVSKLMPNITQSEYDALTIKALEANPNLTGDIATSQIVTMEGKTISVFRFMILDFLQINRISYLDRKGVGIIVSFIVPDPVYEEFQPILEYLLTTFQAD